MKTDELPDWILREDDFLYNINHHHKFIYYQTPKCGSRTLNKIMNLSQDEITLGDQPRKIVDEHHKKYYTFGFVRNPWDRLVSSYVNKIVNKFQHGLYEFWSCNSFKEFVFRIKSTDLTTQDRHIQPQYMFLPGDINFIGRMENFQHDIKAICNTVDLHLPEIPHKNTTKHKHYTEYYDDETREIVAKKYAQDIETFGYKFE